MQYKCVPVQQSCPNYTHRRDNNCQVPVLYLWVIQLIVILAEDIQTEHSDHKLYALVWVFLIAQNIGLYDAVDN